MIILIYPPVAKPCEPPAGIARLSGMLSRHGIQHHLIDANVEGMLHLFGQEQPFDKAVDAWTRRAFKNRGENLIAIKHGDLYHHLDRYSRTVKDIGRVLEKASRPGTKVGLADYLQQGLSPVRSSDLFAASEKPEMNAFYPYFRDRLGKLLDRNKPSAVGISLNYLSQALCTFAMAGFLKRQSANLKVILGGGLVTSWMSRPDWKNPFEGLVDLMVSGPGENTLLTFAGVSDNHNHVAPEYGDFPCKDYFAPGFILPYSASSGCYWGKCSFCPENAEGNTYRPVGVQEVVRDVRNLVEKGKPVLVHFLDNAMSPALLKALSEQPPGVPWYGFARITKDLKDPEFCEALKRSGCRMLKLGLESGDQGVLDSLRKGIDLEMASPALKALKKAGIATYVYLLFGTPAENLEAAERTLEFTVKHSENIHFLNIAIFNMPAHGADADKFETRDFYEGDLFLYKSFVHPGGWDRSAVRRFLDRKFKRHPAIASILRRDPPFFTSNHAPFFCAET